MLDDLDLAWDEQQETRRRRGQQASRQQRQSRRKETKRRRRSFGALFISLLLLLALGGGVYWGVGWVQDKFAAADYEANPAKVEVRVVIKKGSSGTDIADELYSKKVVKSVKAFVKAYNADPRSTGIQPGTYKLFEEMPAKLALSYLLDPGRNLVGDKVTVREGLSVVQTFKVLSKATGIPIQDFEAAAKDPIALGVPAWWYNRSDGRQADKSVEGFLFPDTYNFTDDSTAADILKAMIDQFNTVTGNIDFAKTVETTRGGISPYEALIIASMAQVEAGPKEGDLAKITRVAYNRLFKDFDCGCLQFDVTANYWLERQGKPTKNSGAMSADELNDPRNPWNTGDKSPGLPRGPISNPGKAALQAAMTPADGPWYYFVVVDKQGTTKFSVTYNEHKKNIDEAKANGVL